MKGVDLNAERASAVRGPVVGLDHFQLCCPAGGEEAARAFYGGLLGLPEVSKPSELASRGGCWFRAGQTGLHVGVLEPFMPSTKGHPALRVHNIDSLEALAGRLEQAGHPVDWSNEPIADARCKLCDPFGNLIELLVGTTG